MISWGLTIIIAVTGGTFALTKYSNEQAIKALEQRVAIAEQNDKPKPPSIQPIKEIPSTSNNQGIESVASQLESTERYWSDIAFDNIKSEVKITQAVDITIPVLEKIAVNSSSSLDCIPES